MAKQKIFLPQPVDGVFCSGKRDNFFLFWKRPYTLTVYIFPCDQPPAPAAVLFKFIPQLPLDGVHVSIWNDSKCMNEAVEVKQNAWPI